MPSGLFPRRLLALLFSLFLFRLVFGLCTNIFFVDQQQVFLIGLKFFSTGQWPHFGAALGGDALKEASSAPAQLPGALQGLVVGLPLFLMPLPEAPLLFVGLLSFTGLVILGWYFSKHLPTFPAWMLWTWLLTAPWVLDSSTSLHNVSYVLFGSCLFFVGFLETLPSLSKGVLPPRVANSLMGFALFWNVQFYSSYVVLLPLIALSFWYQFRARPPRGSGLPFSFVGWFLLGCLPSGIFLLPTVLAYGPDATGGIERAIAFNPSNAGVFFTLLARYLSLACAEIPRFLGSNTAERLAFLEANAWSAPFTVTAWILGILQTVLLLVLGFRKEHPSPAWGALRAAVAGIFFLVYLLFLFTPKPPVAHAYYLAFPVVMLYGFYAFLPWTKARWFRVLWGILLVSNILTHVGLMAHNFKTHSLYKDRRLFTKAIQEKDPDLLGELRKGVKY